MRSLLASLFLGACAFDGDPEVASTEQALTAEISPTDSVGSLPGGLSVNFDGQANYSIPIEVPPARAGHEPALAISYASSDAIGALGRGWSLSGLSAVTRCAQIPAIDGAYRAVGFDDEDEFCLDGARLIRAGESNGFAEYRTEQESFVRAFAITRAGIEGPALWEVRRPDGTIWKYGADMSGRAMLSDGSVAASWYVTSIRDRFGNLIEYTYDSRHPQSDYLDPDRTGARGTMPEVLPSIIRYGAHESGIESTASVLFEYEARPDMRSGHSAGYGWEQTRRLARVRTYLGEDLVRTYHLDYTVAELTNTSLLEAVQDCVVAPKGSNADLRREDLVCRPATHFEWSVGDPDAPARTDLGYWSFAIPATRFPRASHRNFRGGPGANFLFADVDGDHRTDAVFERDDRLWIKFARDGVTAPDVDTEVTLPEGILDNRLQVVDYNSDGRADLAFIAREPGEHLSRAWIAVSTGESFEVVPTQAVFDTRYEVSEDDGETLAYFASQETFITDFAADNDRWEQSVQHFGDFDGDGETDIVSCEVVPENGECVPWPVAHTQRTICRGEWVIRRGAEDLRVAERTGVYAMCGLSRLEYFRSVNADVSGDGVPDLVFADNWYLTGGSSAGEPADYLVFARPGPADRPPVYAENELWFDSNHRGQGPMTHWKTLSFDRRHGGGAVALDSGIHFADDGFPYATDIDGDGTSDLVTFHDNASVGTLRPPPEMTTLEAFRTGSAARLVRRAWRSLGDGTFQPIHETEYVEPNVRTRAEVHQNLLLGTHFAEPGAPPPDDFVWNFQDDVVVDLDGDRVPETLTFGLPIDSASDSRHWDPSDGDSSFGGFDSVIYNSIEYWPDRGHDVNVPRLYVKVLDGVLGAATPREEDEFDWLATTSSPLIRGYASKGPYGTGPGQFISVQSTAVNPVDYDGDGDADLLVAQVVTEHDGVSWGTGGPADSQFFRVLYNDRVRPERVEAFVNGFGARTEVEYAPTSDERVYQDVARCDEPALACGAPNHRVVSAVVSDADGHPRRQTYRYWDGRTAKNGRGWLGFRKVSIHDVAANQVSTYRFDNRIDGLTGAYYTNRRPVHATHLVQGDGSKIVGDSSQTIGTEIRVTYDLHRHNSRWSTVVRGEEVLHYEDARYFPLDGTSDTVFSALTPLHRDVHTMDYGDPESRDWTERDLPLRMERTVDRATSGIRELQERHYLAPPSIAQGDTRPWIVGRVEWERSWEEGDDCGGYVAAAYKYDEDHGGLRLTTRQPDELVPPRSTVDREAEVVEHEIQYNKFGNLEWQTLRDLSGRERTTDVFYEYESATFPAGATNAVGHTVKLEMLPQLGLPFAVIDPNGNVDVTRYDGFGRVVGGDGATGDRFDIRYLRRDGEATPMVVVASSSSGSIAAQGMDSVGRTRWAEWRELRDGAPATVRAEQEYDALSRVVRTSEPYFEDGSPAHWTEFDYDEVGTLRETRGPDGTFRFRRLPDRRFATDALGAEQTLVLDGRGNVVQGIEPAPGGTIHHTYCADGRLRESIDPAGNRSILEYDALGRRRLMVDPDRGEEWTEYDAFDQVVYTRDAGNREVKLEYDDLGRLIARFDVSGETRWKFDSAPHGIGQLGSSSSPDGVALEYTYHPNGLLESEKLLADDETLKLTYLYDAFGRLHQVESPVMRTQYDYTAGHLHHVRDASSGRSLWEGRSRNAFGDLREELFGNGLTGTRDYTPGTRRLTGQRVQQGSTRLQDWSYQYDANGRVEKRSDSAVGFGESYTYDAIGRLTKLRSSHDGSMGFQYDTIGNLTFASDVGELAYDPTSRPHAVREFRGVEQHYDSVGNHLGDDERRRVEYNALDLPSNVFRRSDGRSIQMRYDADGNRAVTHGPTGDRYYLGPLELRGNTLVFQVQVDGRTVAQAMRKDSGSNLEIAYVHDDRLGSVDLLTDEEGREIARNSFDAWGARRERPWTSTPEGPDGTPAFDHGFTGHEHDDEWGVIHMRGRAYDPAMRRMTSVDPFVTDPFSAQAFNRYSYVWNDPINRIDPSGFVGVDLTRVSNGYPVDENGTIHLPPESMTVPVAPTAEQRPVAVEQAVDSERAPTHSPWVNPADTATHWVTTRALGAMDQAVWGNPTAPGVVDLVTRHNGAIGGMAAEGVVYSMVRGTVQNAHVASDSSASTGDRAGASAWLLVDLVGGALLGMVAKWAGRGFDLALGLGQTATHARGLVQRFANHVGAKTYWDFFSDNTNVYGRVAELMGRARALRFNLDGLVGGGRGYPQTLREVFEFGADGAGVTNWEFYQAVTNHMRKTTFYANGKRVELLFENGIPVGWR